MTAKEDQNIKKNITLTRYHKDAWVGQCSVNVDKIVKEHEKPANASRDDTKIIKWYSRRL